MSSHTSELFEFPKMISIYALTTGIVTLYGIHYILYRPKIVLSPVFLLWGIFLAVIALSTAFSVDVQTSLFGYYGRWNGGLVSLLAYFLLGWVFLQVATPRFVVRVITASFVTSITVFLWGIPGRLGADLSCYVFTGSFTNDCWTAQFQPEVRMFSTLGQPNWLGAYFATHVFFGAFLIFHHLRASGLSMRIDRDLLRAVSRRYGELNGIVLLCIGIVMTGSRSALIAVGISCGIGLITYFTRRAPTALRLAYRIGFTVVLLITTYGAISWGSAAAERNVPEHLTITDSFSIRQIVWDGAIRLGLKYPFLGTGPETFAYVYPHVRSDAHNGTSEWDFVYNKAHNEFLHYLATTGFLGLVAYLSLLGWGYSIMVKSRETNQIELPMFSLLLAYTSIHVTNFFGFSTSTIQLLMYLIPIMAIGYMSELVTAKKPQPAAPFGIGLAQYLGAVLLFLAGLRMLGGVGAYLFADLDYKASRSALADEKYQEASEYLLRAMRLKYEHVYEDALAGSIAQQALLTSLKRDSEGTAKLISLSKEFSASARRASPQNNTYLRSAARNHYLFYQASGTMGELLSAVELLREITRRAPTDANAHFTLGLFLSVLADESDGNRYRNLARESLNEALRLRPHYEEARKLLQSL